MVKLSRYKINSYCKSRSLAKLRTAGGNIVV